MKFSEYNATLKKSLDEAEVTNNEGTRMEVCEALDAAIEKIVDITSKQKKVMFIGNGGSAAIASHMAIDFWKNGGMRAMSFNDPSQLTCLSNDLGYENVFSSPIDMFADEDDVLVAISSSGKSSNILNAVKTAGEKGCWVISFSGFGENNPLRDAGDLNFYVPDQTYGLVESAHAVICHYILDSILISKNNDQI